MNNYYLLGRNIAIQSYLKDGIEKALKDAYLSNRREHLIPTSGANPVEGMRKFKRFGKYTDLIMYFKAGKNRHFIVRPVINEYDQSIVIGLSRIENYARTFFDIKKVLAMTKSDVDYYSILSEQEYDKQNSYFEDLKKVDHL